MADIKHNQNEANPANNKGFLNSPTEQISEEVRLNTIDLLDRGLAIEEDRGHL